MPIEDTMAKLAASLDRNSTALETLAKTANKGTTANSGAASSAATGTGGNGKKKKTLEDIQKAFGEYMSVTDKDVRNERKANVLKIAGKWGVERATLIPEEHFAEALELLSKFTKGENPFADEDGDGSEESPI